VLEGLGWRLYRIWSTEWFRSPQRESDRLVAAIRAARVRADNPRLQTATDNDLPEHEETDIGAERIEPDETPAVSNAIDYEECSLTAPPRRDLLELSTRDVARIALIVVEAEGPIHTEEVARRVREAFGLQKTGKRILAHVRGGLKHLARGGSVAREGEFWSAVGREFQQPRHRRNAALPLRRLHDCSDRVSVSDIVDCFRSSGDFQ
jgi:hypothetical protein